MFFGKKSFLDFVPKKKWVLLLEFLFRRLAGVVAMSWKRFATQIGGDVFPESSGRALHAVFVCLLVGLMCQN